MITEEIIEDLKKISIRGRVALGIVCLENACKKLEIDDENIKAFMNILWEFTSSNRLDLWEEKITNGEVKFKKHMVESNIPQEIYLLIEEVVEIGCGNLYGGTGEYSHFTLEPLLKVFSIMEQNEFEIPNLKPFMKSKFSEYHGWGNHVLPSVFREEKRKC